MKKLGFLALCVFAFNFVIYAGILLGLASVATSGLKAATDRCGTEYKIESALPVYGSLFCPAEGK